MGAAMKNDCGGGENPKMPGPIVGASLQAMANVGRARILQAGSYRESFFRPHTRQITYDSTMIAMNVTDAVMNESSAAFEYAAVIE
jgi:hypothetical protein